MYTEEQLSPSLYKTVAADIDDLSAAAVHDSSFAVMEQCCVRRLMATVTTATVGAATVEFKFRPDYGSAVGEVSLGSLIIPASSSVGDVVFKDVSPQSLTPGGQVVFEVTSAATSGNALYGFRADLDPEDANNQSQMVESA